MKGAGSLILVIVGAGTLTYLFSGSPSSSPGQSGNAAAATPAPVTDIQRPIAGDAPNTAHPASTTDSASTDNGPVRKWTYRDQSDELRGITWHFATLESDNTLNFSFPYGESTGSIVLRRHGKSVDVMLQMTGGQFVCNSFNDDTVTVKFDNGPIRHFGCAESADGDTKTIFLMRTSRFIKGLKGSSRVRIEVDFFQAGLQQLTFNTTGLKW
ncbi:MAG TPA: hypothetical protein VGL35_11220 [Rhizomicrobium sp.]|jgi:hypothetical protein